MRFPDPGLAVGGDVAGVSKNEKGKEDELAVYNERDDVAEFERTLDIGAVEGAEEVVDVRGRGNAVQSRLWTFMAVVRRRE